MKSHFQMSNQQRNGIFLLVIIIIILQVVIYNIDFSTKAVKVDQEQLADYRKEIEALKEAAVESRKPKIHSFNPNYITDYKGYVLGMSTEEIDRLHKFRDNNQWINSAKQFQDVTKISDSLLHTMSSYFKFPDWVTNKTQSKKSDWSKKSTSKTVEEKVDLNKATAEQLRRVNGVGEKLSKRIVAYRDKHNGFISEVELTEVWGLSPEVINRIKNHFVVKTPKAVITINLNTASRDELVKIPYLDYINVSHIIEQRTLREGFKSFEELTKVEDFPVEKLEIIKLYLHL